MTHFVYAAFDADMQPLYVGCTKDVTRRLKEHARGSTWPSRTAHLFVTEFASEAEALGVERERIQSLRPLHNIRDNPRRMSFRKAVLDHMAFAEWLARRENWRRMEPELMPGEAAA